MSTEAVVRGFGIVGLFFLRYHFVTLIGRQTIHFPMLATRAALSQSLYNRVGGCLH